LVPEEEHLMVVWPGDMQHTFPKKADERGQPAEGTFGWLKLMAEESGCRIDCRGRTGRVRQGGVRDRAYRPTRLTIRGPPSSTTELLKLAVVCAQEAGTDISSVVRQAPRIFDTWDEPDVRKRVEDEQKAAEEAAEAGPPPDSDDSDTAPSETDPDYDETAPDYGGEDEATAKKRRREDWGGDRGRKRQRRKAPEAEAAAEPPSAASAASSAAGPPVVAAVKSEEEAKPKELEVPVAEAAAEPPLPPGQIVKPYDVANADHVVVCDSFLELVGPEDGELSDYTLWAQCALHDIGISNIALLGFPGDGLAKFCQACCGLEQVVKNRNRKFQTMVVISLGNDLVNAKGLKYDDDQWKGLHAARLLAEAKLVGDIVGRIADRVLVVYGGEADKWGGSQADKAKRWRMAHREGYDARVNQVCGAFRECGLETITGAEAMREILTGNSDPACQGCKDAWHFSGGSVDALVTLLSQWITQAKAPAPHADAEVPARAAAAEPPAQVAAVAEPPAPATRSKASPAARETGVGAMDAYLELQAFLQLAEDAVQRLIHLGIKDTGAIAQEAITFIQQIRRRGELPDQLDVFQCHIDRVACCA
jgi:hypothetical protein